jgi:hypothetical protein
MRRSDPKLADGKDWTVGHVLMRATVESSKWANLQGAMHAGLDAVYGRVGSGNLKYLTCLYTDTFRLMNVLGVLSSSA